MTKKKVLLCFGTRPEAIKFAPILREMQRRDDTAVKVCVTAQHREMLDQVLDFFSIRPEYDLDVMRPNQSLYDTTSGILKGLEKVYQEFAPDHVVVQGDTTTAFVGALAAFYKKIRVAHVEAGLRSSDLYSPFPEEANRILISRLANDHFTPTQKASDNLKAEGVIDNVHMVGNSVIDALFLTLSIIKEKRLDNIYEKELPIACGGKRIVLVTGHRRESFGEPFKQICYALREIASSASDVEIIYPVHLNPNVRKPVFEILKDIKNVHLIEPLDYPRFVWLMSRSHIVLTDSGGVQEEAPSLGKPVLVMRDVTERTEGIEAGSAILVGTRSDKIIGDTSRLLSDNFLYERMSKLANPYGDGKTSMRIADIMSR